VKVPPIAPSPPKNRKPALPGPPDPEAERIWPLALKAGVMVPVPMYEAVVPVTGEADKPEKFVGVQVVLVPGPVIVPEQALEVSVTAIVFGPMRESPIVAVEPVNVNGVEVVLDCSGITSPPTFVSARTTLVSVPKLGLKSLSVQD
jgi:hypothetical protein